MSFFLYISSLTDLLPLESCTLFVTVLPISLLPNVRVSLAVVCAQGAFQGSVYSCCMGVYTYGRRYGHGDSSQGFCGQSGSTSWVSPRSLALGLSQITLIITLNLPLFNMRLGW